MFDRLLRVLRRKSVAEKSPANCIITPAPPPKKSKARESVACSCRSGCRELNDLHHHIRNAVLGIERERRIAAAARKEAFEAVVRASASLRVAAAADERMREHLNRIDQALSGGQAK